MPSDKSVRFGLNEMAAINHDGAVYATRADEKFDITVEEAHVIALIEVGRQLARIADSISGADNSGSIEYLSEQLRSSIEEVSLSIDKLKKP